MRGMRSVDSSEKRDKWGGHARHAKYRLAGNNKAPYIPA
jgi:hypothetical protein